MKNSFKISIISYTELWDRISYYGLQSILVLYLTKIFNYSDQTTYTIYGAYTAISYAVTVIGGIIADKGLGLFYACLIGIMFIVLGNTILAIPSHSLMFVGLAIMVVGIGVLKPNNPSLLGGIYPQESPERSRAFSLLYLSISLGSILGPIIYGLASKNSEFWPAFMIGAFGLSSAFIFFFRMKKNTIKQKTNTETSANISLLTTIIILLACITISSLALLYSKLFGWILASTGIIFSLYLLRLLKKLNLMEKLNIALLFVPITACIVYIISFLQIYSALTLFIDRYLNKEFFGYSIPTTWFSSLEPIAILLLIPLLDIFWSKLRKQNKEPKAQTKVIIGLAISSIAFCIFSSVSYFHAYLVSSSIVFIILANILLGIGELCTIPVTMSITNLLAPKKHQSTLMGVFYFSLAFSGYFAGALDKIILGKSENITSYGKLFAIIASMLLLSSVMLAFINSLIRKTISKKIALTNFEENPNGNSKLKECCNTQ